MKILKTPIKLDKSERNINMNLITILNFRYEVIKKALVFSYFFKNAILKLRLRASISYRHNIKNYIKYSKMASLYLTKKNKIYEQRIFNNFMPLHFSYILYNFKLSKIFYETFRRRFLVDASNVISAKHWLTFKQRLNRARYLKKPMVNYWLVPFFKKFFMKINKWQFFNSKFYFAEVSNLKNLKNSIRWYKYVITKFTKGFYNSWFFYLLKKLKNFRV